MCRKVKAFKGEPKGNPSDPTNFLASLVVPPPTPWQATLRDQEAAAKEEAARATDVARWAEAAAAAGARAAASAKAKADVLTRSAAAHEVNLVQTDASWRLASVPESVRSFVASKWPELKDCPIEINPHTACGTPLHTSFMEAVAKGGDDMAVEFGLVRTLRTLPLSELTLAAVCHGVEPRGFVLVRQHAVIEQCEPGGQLEKRLLDFEILLRSQIPGSRAVICRVCGFGSKDDDQHRDQHRPHLHEWQYFLPSGPGAQMIEGGRGMQAGQCNGTL